MRIFKFLIIAIPVLLAGCDNDDDGGDNMTPTSFTVKIENVSTPKAFYESGVFNTPFGADNPGPLFPGDSYEFTIHAGPHVLPDDAGARLSFVTMFVQSNDLFYAPDEEGIALYDDEGNPVGEGGPENVTSQIYLWDAGTEVNETTGGPGQKPQQAPDAEDVGTDENGVVTLVENNMDAAGNTLPATEDVIYVSIAYKGDATFKVHIENVSDGGTLEVPGSGTAPVPLSPGVYVVHTQPSPLFEEGVAASDGGMVESNEGLENIAEDGITDPMTDDLNGKTGLVVPLSPGVYVVHDEGSTPLYMENTEDQGEGLEALAEDGQPTDLAAALTGKSGVSATGVFNTPVGESSPSAIAPGQSYEFTFEAKPGDYLSLATMFVQSNDWFYAFEEGGLDLYDGDDPVNGDVTSSLHLYDAGTEINQAPGAGLDQAIRQEVVDTGADDDNNSIREVEDNTIPDVSEVIKVTITPGS